MVGFLHPSFNALSFDRPSADNRALMKSSRLYFTPLEEVGWIDPSLVFEHAAVADTKSRPHTRLKTVLKQCNARTRVLPLLQRHRETYHFPPGDCVDREVTARFPKMSRYMTLGHPLNPTLNCGKFQIATGPPQTFRC